MPAALAYCLFDNLEVSDPARLEDYAQRVAPLVAQHGGRYLAIGGPVQSLEGPWQPRFPVLIEFPSAEHARGWYDSASYRELKRVRLSAGRFNGVLIEGLAR